MRYTLIFIIGLSAHHLSADERPKEARFDPVKQNIEGWTVHVDPAMLKGKGQDVGKRALRMLGDHLNRISILMPKDRLAKLRKLEIWIELSHPKLRSMQYHPGARWLKKNGHDPRLVKKVHVPQAAALLSRRQLTSLAVV